MPYITLDTETTGTDLLHGDSPFAVSTCDEQGVTNLWEWPVDPHTRQPKVPTKDLKEICEYIRGSILVFHNAKFDVQALRNLGIRLQFKSIASHIDSTWATAPAGKVVASLEGFEDTLLASHVCDSEEPHGLKWLSESYLDIMADDEDELLEAVRAARRVAKSRGWTLGQALGNVSSIHCDYWLPKAVDSSSTVLERYATQDAVRTMLLWKMYKEVLQQEKLEHQYAIRKCLVPITYRMETRGVTVKPRILKNEIERYEIVAGVEEEKCSQIVRDKNLLDEELNIRSSSQLQRILYGDLEATGSRGRGLGCPAIVLTQTGLPSTSAATLLDLYNDHVGMRSKAREFLGSLLRFRKNQTCAQYLISYQGLVKRVDSRHVMHPSFNQTGTRTTRWSSSNPNGQNIGTGGKDEFGNETDDYCLRDVFGPDSDHIWFAADYSQLEMRILAVLAQEDRLIEAFKNDEDIHSLTADLCGISRKAAKGVNYGIIYGAGQAKLQQMTGKKDFNKIFKAAYPGVSKFMTATTKQVQKRGFVKTLGGYRLMVPADKPYSGTNYTIQGSAGDILNLAMIKLSDWLGMDDDHPENNSAHLIMCIHDELVFEFEKGKTRRASVARTIRDLMEASGTELGVSTPVDVKRIPNRWSVGKVLNL